MECPECFSAFNEVGRLPKALPCGHTFCLACLEQVNRCFEDQKEFLEIPTELPNNHNALAMMRSRSSNSASRLSVWCISCGAKASESCVDVGHKICSRKKILLQQARQKLHLSEHLPLDELVDNLDETSAAEALELLSGRIAPLDVLLQGGGARWQGSLQPNKAVDDQTEKLTRCLLLLMHAKGTVQKDLYVPPVSTEKITTPEEAVDPSTILDLTNISSCKNQESMKADKEALLISDSLPRVRRLTGLYCDRDKKWSRQLLKVLAPHLEEVHMYNFHLEHLEVTQKMPQLRWLVLEHFNGTAPSDYNLPPMQHHSKVEFLWCNVNGHKNLKLCSDIIKSHAPSVKVLLSAAPSFHSDTVKFFEEFNLPNLKHLFYLSSYCGSDNCRETMDELRLKYPEVKVICFKCGRTDTYDE